MRVLVSTVANPFTGGHNVQALKTAEALRSLGVAVTLTDEAEPDLDGYDVLHSFGVNLASCRRARARNVPVFLSTIYNRLTFSEGRERPIDRQVWAQRARFGLVMAHRAARGQLHDAAARLVAGRIEQAMLYETADMLLPNSIAEAHDIEHDLGVSTPITVVPNAVDPTVFTTSGPRDGRDGVLYVGRIEPQKNQLGLLEAMKGTGKRLTLVGPGHPHHPDYLREVSRVAEQNGVELIPGADSHELARIYSRHAVHILPSWFETTGLVSLEAAVAGCAVVSTSRGYAREYLGDDAHYCDPGKPGSIRVAVDAALVAGPSETLRRRVLQQYTWANTAEQTLTCYEAVLRRRSAPGSVL